MHINSSITSLTFSLLRHRLPLQSSHEENTFQLLILQVGLFSCFNPGHPIATPEKAVEALSEGHLAYLKEYGIRVCHSSESVPCLVEISPLVSIREEGLDKLKNVELMVPCSVYDRSEVELTEENHQMITDTVALLHERDNTRFIYVV